MKRLLRLMMPLASLGLLPGCSSIPAETVVDREQLCRSWRHQTVSKDDKLTDKTATGIEGNNGARTKWGCVWGRNQIKS